MRTLQEMENIVREFCDQRDWEQFHTPKDLAIGITTEAGELLEIFRFKTDEEIQKNFERYREQIEAELADIFYFVLRFAQMNQIDLANALEQKIKENAKKYPVELAKGNNKKYTEFS